MNSVMLKIVGVVLSVFAVIYFGYQVYMFAYTPYQTEVALIHNFTDQIEIEGIAIKQEQVMENTSGGIVKYEKSSSKKVVGGTTVATVYANVADVETSEKIAQEKAQVTLLNNLEAKKATISSNTQNIVSNIKDQQVEFVEQVTRNDFSQSDSTENAFLEQMLRQQIVLNPEISFASQIEALNNAIVSMESQLSAPGTEIQVPSSGYFTSEVDGYEFLTAETVLADPSMEMLENLIQNPVSPSQNAIGKVITSTDWYFLAQFDTKEADRLEEGDEIQLSFPNSSGYDIKATVEKLTVRDDEEKSVLLLKSNSMNDSVVDLRQETPSIVFDTNKGIKVPKQAMRIQTVTETDENGKETQISQPGVYISMGQVVHFKKIDILYETDDYVISAINSDSEYLQLYDEIILEGDDLYDNKPIG